MSCRFFHFNYLLDHIWYLLFIYLSQITLRMQINLLKYIEPYGVLLQINLGHILIIDYIFKQFTGPLIRDVIILQIEYPQFIVGCEQFGEWLHTLAHQSALL